MKLIALLIKLFIISFYRKNTGFFLFFFFFFFGTVNPGSLLSYHLSIIQSILSSYATLCGVLLLWFFYNYKCTSFVYTTIKQSSGEFLYQLQALNLKKQWLIFLFIHLLYFLPVAIYISIVISYGLLHHQYIQSSLLVLFLMVIMLVSSYYYLVLINRNYVASKPLINFKIIKSNRPKRFLFYLLFYLMDQKKKQLLLLKIFSIATLYIAMVLNRDSFSHDTLVLFLLLILLTHSLIPFQLVQFLEQKMLFIRNLPLSAGSIFSAYYCTYLVVFLPELIYLILIGLPVLSVTSLLAIYFTLVHTLTLYTAVQYSGRIDQNEYVKIIFGISFVSIFFFNSEQYAIWASLLIVIAILLFFLNYKEYETLQE